MSAPDIAGVLAKALPRALHDALRCNCDSGEAHYWQAEEMAPTVADAIRAELRAWLESEDVGDEIVRQANAEDDRHFAAGSSHGLGASEAVWLTLAALAEQVGRVDPAQSDSGSTGIEVCQPADQTSTAGVEG